MWQVCGQNHLIRQLEPALRQGRIAHAYLLIGPPQVGKMTLALNLAQSVNCAQRPGAPCGQCAQCVRIAKGQHADLRVVGIAKRQEDSPARTVIGIADVKEALQQAHLKPYEGASAVIIFDGAEFMSEEAANALLKTLEEPPPQVLILLLTSNEEALLSTIKSRCRSLLLLPMSKAEMMEKLATDYQATPEQAEQLARLSRGCLGWAINALKDPEILERRQTALEQMQETCQSRLEGRFSYATESANLFSRDREAARQALFLWLRWWRDLLLIKEGAQDYAQNTDQLSALLRQASQLTTEEIVTFIKRLLQTLDSLDRNASSRLTLEALMLNLPSTRN